MGDELKKAVAGTIGLLSILPFMPDDLETVTKAWMWCIGSEGFTASDVREAGKAMLKELDKFPVPSVVIDYCNRARRERELADVAVRVVGYDENCLPWACRPEDIDNKKLFKEPPLGLPKRSIEENKAIVRRTLGYLPDEEEK